jgi:hypothetical protein
MTIPATTLLIQRRPEAVAATVERILRSNSSGLPALMGKAGKPRKPLKVNRRQVERRPVKIPIVLYPARFEAGKLQVCGERLAVGLTRDISTRGIGIAYDAALKSRLVVVQFDLCSQGTVQLLTELRWSKKRGLHDYLAGGRFIGLVCEE